MPTPTQVIVIARDYVHFMGTYTKHDGEWPAWGTVTIKPHVETSTDVSSAITTDLVGGSYSMSFAPAGAYIVTETFVVSDLPPTAKLSTSTRIVGSLPGVTVDTSRDIGPVLEPSQP